jgi:uncharacterized membrane protein YeaQ/YmgE (transglycosylase-associated protein family)
MTLETLLLWIIVGAVAGLLADAVVGGIGVGLVGAILVGIIGGIIGGWLFSALNISTSGGIIWDIIVSFVGAVVLLLVLRGLRRA